VTSNNFTNYLDEMPVAYYLQVYITNLIKDVRVT